MKYRKKKLRNVSKAPLMKMFTKFFLKANSDFITIGILLVNPPGLLLGDILVYAKLDTLLM